MGKNEKVLIGTFSIALLIIGIGVVVALFFYLFYNPKSPLYGTLNLTFDSTTFVSPQIPIDEIVHRRQGEILVINRIGNSSFPFFRNSNEVVVASDGSYAYMYSNSSNVFFVLDSYGNLFTARRLNINEPNKFQIDKIYFTNHSSKRNLPYKLQIILESTDIYLQISDGERVISNSIETQINIPDDSTGTLIINETHDSYMILLKIVDKNNNTIGNDIEIMSDSFFQT